MRIVCLGGGPAGLCSAIFLARQGHQVSVFERYSPMFTHGWGVVFGNGLLNSLDRCDAAISQAVRGAAFAWQDQVVAVNDLRPVRMHGGGYSISRRELLRILARRAEEVGVDLRDGKRVGAKEVSGAGIDLVIAADGARSRVRSALAAELGTRVDEGRNRYVWLATDRAFDAFTFPFVQTASGWVWAHAYAFDGTTSTFIVEMGQDTWTGLGFARLGVRDSLEMLERMFSRHLQGARLRLPAGSMGAVPWARFSTVTNRRWHRRNVVFVGDAAHTTHFTIGSGTSLAIEDAMALAQTLAASGPLDQALIRYEQERTRALARMRIEAANSAAWFENVDRYIGHDPRTFAVMLFHRRSSILQHVPPGAYVHAARAAAALTSVQFLRKLVDRPWPLYEPDPKPHSATVKRRTGKSQGEAGVAHPR